MKMFKTIRKKVIRANKRALALLYPRMRPSIVVIGTQKGGTTALSHYLSHHPDVVPALTKELQFFNNDIDYQRGLDFYHSFFESATPARRNKIALDITPGYMHVAEKTAFRLKQYNPGLKLIALLRDPVFRAYSGWQMYKKFYDKNPLWFEEWVRERDVLDVYSRYEPRRSGRFGRSFLEDIKEEVEVLKMGKQIEMPIVDRGFYADQLEYFFAQFPKDNILILSSEEMRVDTQGCLSIVEEFCGIKKHVWLSEQIKPFFEGGYRSEMDPQARALLTALYRPHNEKLFRLLGRRFDWI